MCRALVLTLAVLLAGCGGTAPTSLPQDHGIVFSSSRDGDFEIYVMNADGGNVKQLTSNGSEGTAEADDYLPSWSPDDTKIAFVSTRDHEGDGFDDGEIYVMDAAGDRQTRLTKNETGESGPEWSPRGDSLLFARRAVPHPQTDAESLQFEVAVITPDGSETKTLLVGGWAASGVAPSPDGSKIAFTKCGIEARSLDCEIWIAGADGGGARQLTDALGSSADPAWSPDGTKIAFTSDRDENGECFFHDCSGFNGEIYVMDADGSHQTRLTNDPGDDGSPTWSPDGSRIAFAALRDVEGAVDAPGENYEIYSMDADGEDIIQLTHNTAWDWQPDWR